MSAVTFVQSGYTDMLRTLLAQSLWYAHLFTNDVTLTKDTVKADFVEMAGGGYSPRFLDRWTPPALRAGVAFALADPLIWVIAPDPVPPAARGYYVTSGPDGPLLWAWKAPGAGWQSEVGADTLIVYARATFPPAVG